MMPSGAFASGRPEIFQVGMQITDDRRLPRSAVQRLFGKADEDIRMETDGKALEPHGCDDPVPVAPGTPQKVDLHGKALDECSAQFGEQGGIIAGGCGQCGIERAGYVVHAGMNRRTKVNPGFILWIKLVLCLNEQGITHHTHHARRTFRQ